jgi:hypothetical protein
MGPPVLISESWYKTIVDHSEPPGRERDALAIDARDVLAFGGKAIGEPRVGQSGSGTVDLTAAQSFDEITREGDALALSTGQVTVDEMIIRRAIASRTSAPKPPLLSADSLASSRRSIQVAPGAATCVSTVRSDRVASDRRLRPPASTKVVPSAVASQAIEAQPSFGQIKPWRGRVVRTPNSIIGRKRGGRRTSRTRGPAFREKKRKL